MTKIERLEKYLASGATATPKQINRMFGLSNSADAIYTLRQRGNLIYTNPAVLSDGTRTVKYRVGTPTKAMVAVIHQLGALA